MSPEARAPQSSAHEKRTAGPPLVLPALRLALPNIAENTLQSFVFIVDGLMLAAVGEVELAAIALTGVLLWRLSETVACLRIGTAAYVSRRWGEGDSALACRAATHAAVLSTVLGVAVTGILWPLLPLILRLMGADAEVHRVALLYMLAVMTAFPLSQMRINLSTSLRAAGDTVTPTLATLLVNALNVLLNWVLIFGKLGFPALGMLGAGIATASSLCIGLAFLVALSARGLRPRRLFDQPVAVESEASELEIEPLEMPSLENVQQPGDERTVFQLARSGVRLNMPGVTGPIVRVSAAALVEEVVITIGYLGFMRMITAFGTSAMAAHSAVIRIESLSFMAGVGFAVAASTLVGQSLGRGDVSSAVRALKITALFAMGLMGSLGVVFATIPEWLLGWFLPSSETLAIAVPLILIAAISQPMLAAAMTLAGGLRGAGDSVSPTIAQIAGTVLIRLGLGYVFAFPLGWGLLGVYWATVVDWVLRSSLLLVLTLRGRWRRVRV